MFDDNLLNNFAMQAAAIIPIITAVVQALKLTGYVKDKFTPFVAMLVGVGITFLLAHDAMADLSGSILLGILFGLASSGLYSGLQHTAAIIRTEKADKQQKQQQKQQQQQQQTKVEEYRSTTIKEK